MGQGNHIPFVPSAFSICEQIRILKNFENLASMVREIIYVPERVTTRYGAKFQWKGRIWHAVYAWKGYITLYTWKLQFHVLTTRTMSSLSKGSISVGPLHIFIKCNKISRSAKLREKIRMRVVDSKQWCVEKTGRLGTERVKENMRWGQSGRLRISVWQNEQGHYFFFFFVKRE